MTESQASNGDSNPYASPTTDSPSSAAAQATVNFVPILLRWEKLRLYYNLALALVVVLETVIFFPQQMLEPEFWVFVLIGAGVANLCFTTGPAIEAYGSYFRIWPPIFTYLLFLAGLGFTMALAVASVAQTALF